MDGAARKAAARAAGERAAAVRAAALSIIVNGTWNRIRALRGPCCHARNALCARRIRAAACQSRRAGNQFDI